MECQRYEFTPLLNEKAIRVLVLLPGRPGDLIHITISSITLDDGTHTYNALSYTWGDPSPVHTVVCDGAMLGIAENLFAALNCLRSELDPITLWVDAICIDQNNVDERNHQVRLIGSIYSIAHKVLVWTGKDNLSSRTAFILFRDLASLWLVQTQTKVVQLDEEGLLSLLDKDGFWKRVDCIKEYFGRPWFSRAWTFQEICLSHDAVLICGKDSIPWATFHEALSILWLPGFVKYLDREATTVRTIDGYWDYLRLRHKDHSPKQGDTLRLSYLLRRTEENVASDPRDGIFSLLGIASLKGEDYFQPDYSQSVRDTYLHFTRLCIAHDGHLEILSEVYRARNSQSLNLPSWVPDWREVSGANQIAMRSDEGHPKYRINKTFKPSQIVYQHENKNILCLKGAFFDIIKTVYDLTPLLKQLINTMPKIAAQSSFKHFRQFQDNHSFPTVYSITGEEFTIALVRTLSADSVGAWGRMRDEQRFGAMCPWPYDLWRLIINNRITIRKILRRISPGLPVKQERASKEPVVFANNELVRLFIMLAHRDATNAVEEQLPLLQRIKCAISWQRLQEKWRWLSYPMHGLDLDFIVRNLVEDIIHWSLGRSLFLTEKGFIGIGPRTIQPGDRMCTIMGGDVPFVVRTIRVNEPWNYLIGESYIHGVMDGELWRPMTDDRNLVPVHDDLCIENIVLL